MMVIDNPDGTVSLKIWHEKKKSYRYFIECKAPVFKFKGANLLPGNYCVSFSFLLPTDLPSTIFYKNRKREEKPKAKVKYTIKAKI